MGTSRATFKINFTKDNGMLTDLIRVKEGRFLKNLFQLCKKCSGLTEECMGGHRRGCVAFAGKDVSECV